MFMLYLLVPGRAFFMGNSNSLCLLRTSIKLSLNCDLNGSERRETKIYSDTRMGFGDKRMFRVQCHLIFEAFYLPGRADYTGAS